MTPRRLTLFALAAFAAGCAPAGGQYGGGTARTYGTAVRYSLNVDARVKFTVERAANGKRSGRRCVKPTRANRRARSCARYVAVAGSFSHSGRAGTNRLRFSGRLAGRKLAPGRYRLVATPAGGKARRTSFRIKKP